MSEAITIDHDLAAANIETFAREGRLVQGEWHGRRGGGSGGVEIACLLGSIHPSINSAGDCPASLMPYWLARLTVRLFDGVPRGRAAEFGFAYAERLHRWRVIDGDGWERVRRAFVGEVLGDAMENRNAKIPDPAPEIWAPIKALYERLTAMLLAGTASATEYRTIRDDAYWAAPKVVAAVAVAVAAEAAEAVAAAGAVAEAGAAGAAVAAAAAVAEAAEAVAAAGAVAEAAARRTSYARSFETLLRVIDGEIAR